MRTTVMWVAALFAFISWGCSKDLMVIESALKELSAGRGSIEKLRVIYDDIHGLHGGLRLEIRGSGRVEQKVVGYASTYSQKVIDKGRVMELVSILIEEEAWEQRVPSREPFPDESRAKLIIIHGENSTLIWEWYNDLESNRRIIKIREVMEDIAWQRE